MSIQIEAEVEKGIRAALRLAVAAQSMSVPVPVRGFWSARDADDDLNPPEIIPAIYVQCSPYVPAGADGSKTLFPAGECAVEVRARWNPSEGTSEVLSASLWAAVQTAIYGCSFSFSGGIALSQLIVIDGTDSGIDQHGAYASVRFRCPVEVTQ